MKHILFVFGICISVLISTVLFYHTLLCQFFSHFFATNILLYTGVIRADLVFNFDFFHCQ